MKINPTIVKRLLKIIDKGLVSGAGEATYNGDKKLRWVADRILDTLKALKSPGCKYLRMVK